MLWVSSLLFVSIWMFILGILVGRGTAPVPFDINTLQNELKHLKAAALKKEENRFKILSDPENKGLEFHDELKKKTTRAVSRKTVLRSKKGVTKKSKTSDNRVIQKTADTAGKKNLKQGAGDKNRRAESTLTIQVASFKNRQDAESLVLRLKKKGYPAYRALGVVPEKGIWYRVRVGHFNSRQEARKTVARLKGARFKPIILGENNK